MILLDLYRIYKIKKWYRLKNGYFVMISYMNNPYYISNTCIVNCRGEKQNLIHLRYGNINVNRDLVTQKFSINMDFLKKQKKLIE